LLDLGLPSSNTIMLIIGLSTADMAQLVLITLLVILVDYGSCHLYSESFFLITHFSSFSFFLLPSVFVCDGFVGNLCLK